MFFVDMRSKLCLVCFTHPVKSKTALSVFISLPPPPLLLPVKAQYGKVHVSMCVLLPLTEKCAAGRRLELAGQHPHPSFLFGLPPNLTSTDATQIIEHSTTFPPFFHCLNDDAMMRQV